MNTANDARAALMRAIANEHSSFYRDLYAARGFDYRQITPDAAGWRRVPTFSKADIIAAPVKERFFLPLSQTETITSTSGTSGKGIVIMPRHMPSGSKRGEMVWPGTSMLVFYYHAYTAICARGDNPQYIYTGDVRRFPQSASLALQMKADSLLGMPSVLIAFANHLPAEARANIRYLNFNAERLSRLQDQVLNELYPNALHSNMYASRELAFIAQAKAGDAFGPFLMEPFPEVYLELMGESDLRGIEDIDETAEGELVVTRLADAPFPLIRYRTGDRIRVHPRPEGPRIEVLGRAEEERVLIPGGELVLAELERAIMRVFGGAVADFQGEVRETKQEGAVVTGLDLTLFSHTDLVLPADAGERLARELRVNHLRTWQEGVAHGFYLPIACAAAPASVGEGKRKNLIDTRT